MSERVGSGLGFPGAGERGLLDFFASSLSLFHSLALSLFLLPPILCLPSVRLSFLPSFPPFLPSFLPSFLHTMPTFLLLPFNSFPQGKKKISASCARTRIMRTLVKVGAFSKTSARCVHYRKRPQDAYIFENVRKMLTFLKMGSNSKTAHRRAKWTLISPPF